MKTTSEVTALNIFDRKLKENGWLPLTAKNISTIQVNMGYKCNLRCTHCHVEASPDRKETMPPETVDRIIDILQKHHEIMTVDITGGSPEYNLNYKRLVKAASSMGKKVIVRTNLAVWSEPGMEGVPCAGIL